MTKHVDTMELWNSVERTDPYFTKEFNRGGGFKGTATVATYLVKKATKMFGPIGIGWGFDVVQEEMMKGHDQTLIHKIQLKVWYVWNGQRGEITQFGQTTFVGKNKHGWVTDEEAPKKSLTDALTKCLSYIGFAADIHLGLYDDNKYVNGLKADFDEEDEFRDPIDTERRDEPQEKREDDRKPRNGEKKDQVQDDPSEGNQPQENDFDRIRKAIETKATYKDVLKLMTHRVTQAALKRMSKEDADDLRALGQQRMKELGWCDPSDKAKSQETDKVSADQGDVD